MTPGYAKTRQELPWLYYPEADSVIINAHNFGGGGAFSPAVNGKMPVAAWIPSRTQDVADFFGISDGSLQNGAAIVEITGSGGSHAVQTSVTGEKHVLIATTPEISNLHAADFSVSAWAYSTVSNNNQTVFSSASAGTGWFVRRNDSSSANSLGFTGYFSSGNAEFTSNNGAFVGNQWIHIAVVFFAATKTVNLYVNGSETSGYSESTAGIGAAVSDAVSTKKIGMLGANGQLFTGLLDDIRIWDVALDAADVADLATGRGVDVA